jgi:transcriptional regulator with XRE-family HTH domain
MDRMDDTSEGAAPHPQGPPGRPLDSRAELSEFLRSRRARLQPQDVGLTGFGRHRRVPGLRREELAQLAGVSVAYYTRLEQGNGRNVSSEVLDAIARALRLTDAEHAHLTRLAKPKALKKKRAACAAGAPAAARLHRRHARVRRRAPLGHPRLERGGGCPLR